MIGGINMTNTINLFKTGKVAALPAKDLEPKITTYWNYGFDTEVLGVSFKTEKTLTVELNCLNTSTGATSKINRRMTALVDRSRIIYK